MHRMLSLLALGLSLLLPLSGLAAQSDEVSGAAKPRALSHMFVAVVDTDETIDFWVNGLGGEVESDEELMAPALDGIFGRVGVKIRSTFIRVGGIRIHTIETLDLAREFPGPPASTPQLGLGGISLYVDDLDVAHARAERDGRSPSSIYEFNAIEEPVRMFFLQSPSRVRVEMIAKNG